MRPKKSGKRIDGVVASIMALKMLAAGAGPGPRYSIHVFGGPT